MDYSIKPVSTYLDQKLKQKIDRKTKPLGSLGQVEQIAYRVGRIQQSLSPHLSRPVVVVVGADHGICTEGVSPCPIEVTWQQMLNFASGGGAIPLFARHNGMSIEVIDAGVNYDFTKDSGVRNFKVRKATRNFLYEPAMTRTDCEQAIQNGATIVEQLSSDGSNVIAFGEMGIGNTSPASILMSLICDIPIEQCVGPGSGLDSDGVTHKVDILQRAISKNGKPNNPIDVLATYGGLEIATIVGGMIRAAQLGMVIINDGFIITSALLVAQAIDKNILDYTLFAHQSKEQGHQIMVRYMNGHPILNLDLRLGEGTGAAMAYPIIAGAVRMLNSMTSFDDTQITDTTDKGIRIL